MPKSLKINIEKMPDDPTLPDRLWPLFKHFLRQIPGLVLVIFILNSFVAVGNAIMPYFIGQIVDVIAGETGAGGVILTPSEKLELLIPYAAAFIGICLLLLPLFEIARDYINIMVFIPRFGNMVRRQTHWYTLRHALPYFQNDFAGRITNKVHQMGPAMRDVISRILGSVMYVGVFILTTSVLVIQADPVLIWPMMVWVCLYILTLRTFIPQVRANSIVLSEAASRIVGRVVDAYTNIVTVKLFSRREFEDDQVISALENHSDRFADKNRKVMYMNVTLSIINSAVIGFILVYSMFLWRDGRVTAGDIAMIFPLLIQIKNQMHWVKWEVTGIFEWLGMTEDSMQTLAVPHQVTDDETAPPLIVKDGALAFDDVSFHYGKEGGDIIENFSLDIPAGQKVGLVGYSGAGKSTIVNLLLRFYDLESGRVLIDGQDIADVQQDSLRSHIAMVTQDTSLLHRSIFDNIEYGRPGSSLDEVIAAAKKAKAHEFILDLEDNDGRRGYDAHVGERGVKLSGGQRQRIAIARIILKDAPILILDEATSALDSETENYIQDQLKELMGDKTVIAIAHRLSTIAHMDRLLIIDQGKIVEDGKHSELLEKEGHYAKMWKLQSGGFLPDQNE